MNIKTSDKYVVLGGYYFVDGEQFIGFIRLIPNQTSTALLEIGDYLCCTQSGCTFRIISKPDEVTYVIGGIWKEAGLNQTQKQSGDQINAA